MTDKKVTGKAILGVEVFAESLLAIPKALISNAGHDVQESLIGAIMDSKQQNTSLGINLDDGKPMNPVLTGVFHNYCVKKLFLTISPVLVQQLLLVDEIIRAGKQMNKGADGPNYQG